MVKIYNNVTELIGGTPLVYLNSLAEGLPGRVAAKLEYYNPGNSVKDRIGAAIINDAEESGALKPGGTVVEATSGNTGIALALVGAARGYHVILTMPETMSKERRVVLRALGAEIILTPGTQGMKGAVDKAQEIVDSTENAILARQFANPANTLAHRTTTAEEIWSDTDGEVDIFVAGVGTGGTITGVGQVLKERKPEVQVIAVEPDVSPLLRTGKPGPHKLQGLGTNFVPEVLDKTVYDEVLGASLEDSIEFSRRAAREEGIFGGISSGSALWAAVEVAKRPENEGKLIVTVIPDFGERYISTALFDDIRD